MKKVTTLSLLILAFNAFAQRVSGPITEQTQRALPAIPEGALFFEGFENGNFGNLSQNWTSSSLSNEGFYTGISGNLQGQANENGFWPVPKHGIFAMTNDDACNCNKSSDQLTSKTFDLRGLEKLTFGFEAFQNGAGNQIAWLEFYHPQSGWANVKSIPASSVWQRFEVEVDPQFFTSEFKFRFHYSDQGNYSSGLALDNIYLREGYVGRAQLLNYYTIDGDDPTSTFLYESMPLSQAQYANFQFGAQIKNETENLISAKLSSAVVSKLYDTSAVWNIYPNQTAILKSNFYHRFTPTAKGNYVFTTLAMAAENDSAIFPNALTQLFVSDSLYYRVAPTGDGTGIWLQNDNDEIGTVFHLFKTDTVKSVYINLHPTSSPNSTLQVSIYKADNLDTAVYNSPIELIGPNDISSRLEIEIDSVFEKGKYVFSIKRLSGNTIISTRQDKSAKFGEVIYKNGTWNQFAYFPFISVSFPLVNPNCTATIVGDINLETCAGQNDAFIDLSRSTFGMTSTISWSNGGSGLSINNLQPGNYSVTVNDTSGCIYQNTFEIAGIFPLALNEVVTPDFCSQGVGKIEFFPSGGTEPYFLQLDTNSVSSVITSLNGGAYDFTLTDLNGCQINETLNVSSSQSIYFNASITQPDCGVSNGEIALIPAGSAPFTYEWSTTSLDSNINNLDADVYHVTITDAIGCIKDTTIMLGNLNAALINAQISQPTCSGSDDGTINLNVNGGSQPFTYQWTNGDTTQNIIDLLEGQYSVTVEDALGCLSFHQETLTSTQKSPLVNILSQGGFCDKSSTTLKALTLDSTSISYLWSNGSALEELENLTSGTYYVSVTNALGCTTVDSSTILVRDSIAIVLDSVALNIDSIGFNQAQIFVSISGGTPAYQLIWNNGSKQKDIVVNDTGWYELNVTDQFGCQANFNKYISSDPASVENLTLKIATIKAYPNPIIGNTLIIESDEKIASIEVFDLLGNLIISRKSINSNRIVLELSNDLPSGTYICKSLLINNQNIHTAVMKLR